MLTTRVAGSLAAVTAVESTVHAPELLSENPPPRTPNLPATAGSESTAIAAFPPFRFRSSPQPQRDERGRSLGVELGDFLEVVSVDMGHGRGPFQWPLGRPLSELVGPQRVLSQKRVVLEAILEQEPMHSESDDHIRPWSDLEMDVGTLGQAGPSWVDHDQSRACLLGRLDVGDEMDRGPRRVGSPEHDETCLAIVGVRHTRHPTVKGLTDAGGRSRAHRPGQPRGAELSEEQGVRRVLRHESVGASIREREDGLGSVAPL